MPESYPDLSAKQLGAVVAVADYRSFVAAASAMKMSQSGLTRLIQQVEAELGVTLFSRSTRHVSVTDAGKEFSTHAERLLNDLKFSVGNVREKARDPRGQIIVSSVLPLANAALGPLIADYSRKFPGIDIHLREGLHGNVRDEVRSGLADFGVGYVEDLPDSFVTEAIASETFFVVLPADHSLARRKTVELRALTDVTLVSFPPESRTRRAVDAAVAAHGWSLRYAMTANRLPTLLGLVKNRVGLAVVPFSERPSSDNHNLTSRPLVGQRLSCQIGVMRLRERELSLAAAELLAVVRTWMLAFRREAARRGRATA